MRLRVQGRGSGGGGVDGGGELVNLPSSTSFVPEEQIKPIVSVAERNGISQDVDTLLQDLCCDAASALLQAATAGFPPQQQEYASVRWQHTA